MIVNICNKWNENNIPALSVYAYGDLHPLNVFSHFANLLWKMCWFTRLTSFIMLQWGQSAPSDRSSESFKARFCLVNCVSLLISLLSCGSMFAFCASVLTKITSCRRKKLEARMWYIFGAITLTCLIFVIFCCFIQVNIKITVKWNEITNWLLNNRW